jgi:hypothetical protein
MNDDFEDMSASDETWPPDETAGPELTNDEEALLLEMPALSGAGPLSASRSGT